MKAILFTMIFSLTTLNAHAALFEKIYHYIEINSGKVVELSAYDIDKEKQTGTYFDYAEGKKFTVNMSELSKETREEINGVRAGKMILIPFQKEVKACAVYYLFENGMAEIGCQTGAIVKNIGMDRPERRIYIAKNVEQNGIIAEVDSLNGISKKAHATLKTKTGSLLEGEKVRVEVIFANGEALVQKMGLNLLDTSEVIMKFNIERVNLSDLSID